MLKKILAVDKQLHQKDALNLVAKILQKLENESAMLTEVHLLLANSLRCAELSLQFWQSTGVMYHEHLHISPT